MDLDCSLAFVQTGGTIDKSYPKRLGGYNFEIGDAAVQRIISRNAAATKTLNFYTALQKDSQDITLKDREFLAHFLTETGMVREQRIVLTHGTDTLIETAAFLAEAETGKTLVLTGAFLPETFKDSDADFNVGFAAAAARLVFGPGVFVAMQGRLYRWDQVKRDGETGDFVAKKK